MSKANVPENPITKVYDKGFNDDMMNTMKYTHLIDFREDDFHSATTKTVEEAAKLVEA